MESAIPTEVLTIEGKISEGSIPRQLEEALEVEDHIMALEMNEGKLPKLPVYKPKGVWTNDDDVSRQQAQIWAYEYFSDATEETRRFIVNAVAAIFEWQLLQFCSAKCAKQGPCSDCGHWNWVSKPLSHLSYQWEIRPLRSDLKTSEDCSAFLRHPEVGWMTGPGSLISKEGMRCAVSVIMATKADFWANGPLETEVVQDSDELVLKSAKKLILGKYASTMVQDLYPNWSIDDAAQPVTMAGLWANTRNILAMIGETPLPKCIPLWDMAPGTKLILGPDLIKSFASYPAGSEEALHFLKIAKDLVSSPLLIFFPNAEDLIELLQAKSNIKQKPFHYHVCAKKLGIVPIMEHDIRSIYGRLGSYYLANAKANNKPLTKFWSVDQVKKSKDYDEQYNDLCEAFYGLKATTEEAACVLLQAKPKNDLCGVNNVLGEFQMNLSEKQERILVQE